MKLLIRYLWSDDDDVEVVVATPNQSGWSIDDRLIFWWINQLDICDLMMMMLTVEVVVATPNQSGWSIDDRLIGSSDGAGKREYVVAMFFLGRYWLLSRGLPQIVEGRRSNQKLRQLTGPIGQTVFGKFRAFLRVTGLFYCFAWQNTMRLETFLNTLFLFTWFFAF